MHRITAGFFCVLLTGCTESIGDTGEPFHSIIGQWSFVSGPENCKEYGVYGFKQNHTFTYSSENCEIANDGFGMYQLGWYLHESQICFFSEEALESVRLNPDLGRCNWLVQSYSKDQFNIQRTYEFNNVTETESLILRREQRSEP